MKTLLKTTRLIYFITIYPLLLGLGLISWPVRKFLQWLYLIDEDYLEEAVLTDFVKMKIRQNKRINLRFLFDLNDKIIGWFNKKIYG
jgi:hypothetical protein